MEDNKQMTVAIIGASNNRKKYSNKALRAYLISGFKVYPVNPKEDIIEGIKSYKSILDIEDEIDRATLYIPPQLGIKVIDDIAKKGVKELYINPGAESDELVEKAKKTWAKPYLGL